MKLNFLARVLSNAWENPIDGTDFNSTVLLSADDIASGLSIRVWPWETKIEPMRNFASATAEFLSGAVGR